VDEDAVLAADDDRLVGGDGLAVHAGARVRAAGLGAVRVEHADPGPGVLGALADDDRAVLELDRDTVVRGGGGERPGVGRAVGDVLAVDHRDGAGAVVEQGGASLVGHDVAGLLGGEGRPGEHGARRVVVRVVAVGLGPHPGIEDGVSVAGVVEQAASRVSGRASAKTLERVMAGP
jgi:hypothetical protein